MNDNLRFDFNVNKETKTVEIIREFNANLELVWDAWTTAKILDQWWAPKPYASKTKYMDFKVGGKRFYAMVSPEGKESWAIQEYKSITPKTNFAFFNVFADKDETPQPPGSDWELNFSNQNGKTKVTIIIFNESLTRMENLLEGFKSGMTATLQYLDELLTTLKK